MLRPTSYYCPFYNEKLESINKKLHKTLSAKYRKLLDFLTVKTGYNDTITIAKAARLNDLNREIGTLRKICGNHSLGSLVHQMKQPDWVYKKWPEYGNNNTLDIVTDLDRILRNAEFNDITLAYLRGGFLLHDFIQRAVMVANKSQTAPSRMMLYSSVVVLKLQTLKVDFLARRNSFGTDESVRRCR